MYTFCSFMSNYVSDIRLTYVGTCLISVLILAFHSVVLLNTLTNERDTSFFRFKGIYLNCIVMLNVTLYEFFAYVLLECYMFCLIKVLGVTNLFIIIFSCIMVTSISVSLLTSYGEKKLISNLTKAHKIELNEEINVYTKVTNK